MASKQSDGCIIRFLRWFNLVLIVLTGICYFAPYFPADTFWPFIFLGMGFPIIVFMNMAAFLFWAYLKKWYAILPLMCLIMCWSGVSKFLGSPFEQQEQPEGSIQILTYNSMGGGYFKKNGTQAFIDKIKSIDPDIICLQEIGITLKKYDRIRENYPYVFSRHSQSILSKYPIIHKKDLELEKIRTDNGAIYANIKINNSILRVYNLHLHSNKISGKVGEISKNTELEDLNNKETWNDATDILKLVKRSAAVRAEQAHRIKKDMDTSPYPILVCGDFNDPPQSYTYHTLSKGLKDTFVEKGKGFGFTYKGKIPFLKIDYILTSPSLKITSTQLDDSWISDHKLLHSSFVLPTK